MGASDHAAQELDPTFPRSTIHDLRHTAASLAVGADANLKAVQRMLGHTSAAMTLDVYADLFDKDLVPPHYARYLEKALGSCWRSWSRGSLALAPRPAGVGHRESFDSPRLCRR